MIVKLEDVCYSESSNLKQSDLIKVPDGYPVYGASGFIANIDKYQQEKPYISIVKDGAGIGRVQLCPGKSSVIGTMQYIIPKENVLPKYLYYVTTYMHLEKYYTGATIPHIYFKDYKREKFNLDSIEKQKNIVNILDRCWKIIELRKEQLEKYDDLIKARFIEMFGETDRFDSKPLDDSVEEMFIGPFGSSLKNECFVSFDKGYCMVYEQKHAIKKTMNVDTRYVDENKYKELRRFTVRGGDIIVSCRGTIGETFIVPENAPIGIMHPSIMKIRFKSSVYNRIFFNYLLQDVLKQHKTDANGSGVKMAITATALGKELFIRPSIDLQIQFATFVKQIDKSKFYVMYKLNCIKI